MRKQNKTSFIFITLFLCMGVRSYAITKGDVNRDGVINDRDITALERLLVNPSFTTTPEMDVDEDTLVDSYDLYRLKRYVSQDVDHLDWDVRFSVRDLSLQLDGPPLHNIPADQENSGTLQETSVNRMKQTWPIHYKVKGGIRFGCEIPPLNIKFEDNPFPGLSTYDGTRDFPVNPDHFRELGYQKIRLTSRCSVIDLGSDVQLREYMSSVLLRMFKIPTPEVVAFGRVRFRNIDHDDSRPFLIYQRHNEEDDEIPFTAQFRMQTPLIEASDIQKSLPSNYEPYDIDFNHYAWGVAEGRRFRGEESKIQLNTASLVRLNFLSDFGFILDLSPFHNEDYACDAQQSNCQIIPHSLDFSWQFRYDETDNLFPHWPIIYNHFNNYNSSENLSPETLLAIFNLERNLTNEVNNNADNLNALLLAVDRFPFEVDKVKFKHSLKSHFYIQGLYRGSPLYEQYVPLAIRPVRPLSNSPLYFRELKRLQTSPQFKPISINEINNSITALTPYFSVPALPQIISEPSTHNIEKNSRLVLSIDAVGSGSLQFQWMKNGVPLLEQSGRTEGVRTSALEFPHVAISDSGDYSCDVRNAQGHVVSYATHITVQYKLPLITKQPENVTSAVKQPISFSVTATSEIDMTYQWKKNGINMIDDLHSHGAKTATLHVDNVEPVDAGNYSCDVSNLTGVTMSQSATLTVEIPDIRITQNPPSSILQSEGQDVTIEVKAESSVKVFYNWKKGDHYLDDGNHTPGANSSNLTIKNIGPEDAGVYSCEVRTDYSSKSSFSSFLTVNRKPTIQDLPKTIAVDPGAECDNISFTVWDDRTPVENLDVAISESALFDQLRLEHGAAPGVFNLICVANDNPGETNLTVTVQDREGGEQEQSIIFTINNTPPILENIPSNISLNLLNNRSWGGRFKAFDAETGHQLTVTATQLPGSTVFNPSGIIVRAADSSAYFYDLFLNPNEGGTAKISVTATDAQGLSANKIITVTVAPPKIFNSVIPDSQINQNQTFKTSFSLFEKDVTLEGTSSNPALIEASGIIFQGRQLMRTLGLTPKPNQTGETIITLRATYVDGDYSFTDQRQFKLTVRAVAPRNLKNIVVVPAPNIGVMAAGPVVGINLVNNDLNDSITLVSERNLINNQNPIAFFDLQPHNNGVITGEVFELLNENLTLITTLSEQPAVAEGLNHFEWDSSPMSSGRYMVIFKFNGQPSKPITVVIVR